MRRMSCDLGKLSDFRIFASLGKVQLHKTPVRAAEFSECPILFCDLYIFLQQDTIVLKFILNLQWFSQACGARTLAEESANRSEMHARHFPRRCEGWKSDAGRVGDKRESLIYIKRLSMRLFLATWNFATFKGTAGQCSNRCSWDVFIEIPADLACTQYANMRTHMPIRMWVNCINASAWASCCSFYCSG